MIVPSKEQGISNEIDTVTKNKLVDLSPTEIPANSVFISYRVHNGERIGIGLKEAHGKRLPTPTVGEKISGGLYATNALRCQNVILRNDEWAQINTGNPYDNFQQVLVILTQKWSIPPAEFDESVNRHWAVTDTDQITIDEGEVLAVLTPNQFAALKSVLEDERVVGKFQNNPVNPEFTEFMTRIVDEIMNEKSHKRVGFPTD